MCERMCIVPAAMNSRPSLAEDQGCAGAIDRVYGIRPEARFHANGRYAALFAGLLRAADIPRWKICSDFAGALTNHKLLNAENTDLLTTGKVGPHLTAGKYAFGFSFFDDGAESGARHFRARWRRAGDERRFANLSAKRFM